MPKRALTDAAIGRLKKPKTGQDEHFDAGFPGLALRISYGGRRAWVMHYRINGKQRRMTIGRYPEVGLADARQKWREARTLVEEGVDPAHRNDEASAVPTTVREVADEFFARYARPRNRTANEIERMFEIHVYPAIGHLKANKVAQRDILRVLDLVQAGGATVRANRVLTNLKRLFSWAQERGYVEASPAVAVRPPVKESSRDRVLDEHEITAFLDACRTMGEPFGLIFHLLMMTGQRRDEVAGARWDEIDLSSGTWVLSAERTKNGRLHEVTLPKQAIQIVNALPQTCELLFPARFSQSKSNTVRRVSGFTKAKQRVDGLMLNSLRESRPDAELMPWRLHDLRRTAATGLARLGTPIHITEGILNHVSGSTGGIVAVYQRHDYSDEKRDALQRWADYLDGLG